MKVRGSEKLTASSHNTWGCQSIGANSHPNFNTWNLIWIKTALNLIVKILGSNTMKLAKVDGHILSTLDVSFSGCDRSSVVSLDLLMSSVVTPRT